MIKSQLIESVAAKMTHLSEKKVGDGINRILELMSQTLIEGDRIEIRGFGSFSLRRKPPRKAHNPKTGEDVFTTEKSSAHFRAGKELKERVTASKIKYPLKKK